jgi:hypothetical protein
VFLLSRRQTRAALAAGAGAAVYLAASELGKDKLKLTGLFVLASASMAGMVTAKASPKAANVESRLNTHVAATAPAVNLQANGGTIGGTLNTTGKVNPSGQGRADLAWTPNTHQGSSPASYSQSFTDNTVSRVNDIIDQLSLASDRADWIRQQLSNNNVVIN